MVLLISYDLNGRERPSAYDAVRQVIERDARDWIKPLYSQWLVDADRSPRAWMNALEAVIDADDRVLIVQVVNASYWGFLDREVWEWLAAKGLQPAN